MFSSISSYFTKYSILNTADIEMLMIDGFNEKKILSDF
jgi:penicillin V acylase-like amidase (Ntn superfamily)